MHIMELIQWVRTYSTVPMLAMFLLIVIAAYWPREKARIECHGLIPLQDDR
jgi:cbb3-type cytochrome oxidase subunit 3